MEEHRSQQTKPASRGIFTLLQTLQLFLLLGLIAVVIYFQLQNNSRLDKLEVNRCLCEDRSSYTKATKANLTKDDFGLVTPNSKPITKRDLEKQMHDNYTIGYITNQSAIDVKLSLSGNGTSKLKTQQEKDMRDITKVLDIDLISCATRLKVIIEDYLASNKNPKNKECASKGQKGDKGPKGQQGERGCAALSFAPPYVEPRSRAVVTNEGETVVLKCNATANPVAKVKWYRDGKLISGKRDSGFYGQLRYGVTHRYLTPVGLPRRRSVCPSELPHPVIQSSLVIRGVTGSDTGIYSCNAHNFMGDTSFDIQLNVHEYVRCSIIPSNITVVESDDVLLSCRASGVPSPSIKWYRKDIGPMPSHHRVAMGDLHIKNISKEEEGTFVCMAENVLGSKTAEATVTVNVFPVFHTFLEKTLLINKTEDLILPCNATGYPQPEISWQKINGSLPNGRYVYDSQLLNITKVHYSDGGEYKCTARNSVATISTAVTVDVQIPPVIIHSPDSTEFGFKDKTKILYFEVFSKPEATVTWLIPSHGQKTQRIRQENNSLVIDNVQYKDTGHYQAVARNLLGEVRARVFMIVRDPVPGVIRSLVVHPQQSTFLEGQNITLDCLAVGTPGPIMTWQRDNETLTSSKGYELTLRLENATVNDTAGIYACTIFNQFGSDRRYFDLKVIKLWVRVKMNYNYGYWENRYRHKEFSRSSGQITSYQYPNTYLSNRNDWWTLTSNTRIKLEFVKFETERCCDKVTVYDGSSAAYRKLGEFSGEELPSAIISSSKSLYVTFRTDGSKGRSGFKAFYSAII